MVFHGSLIEDIKVSNYSIPTDRPESDGTLAWDSTTMVVVQATSGKYQGLGYTYADAAAGALISGLLSDAVTGQDAFGVTALYDRMSSAVRNNGEGGLCRMAIAAVDIALWDLKARILEVPLYELLGGAVRQSLPIYGSGGFTSYDRSELQEQLGGWARRGMRAVKMKIGRHPRNDPERMAWAREAIGDAALFVDANAAFDTQEALDMADRMRGLGVTWFEEPVHHRDRKGLAHVRRKLPPGMAVAAGEYAFTVEDARDLIEAEAVDVMMADATRCGITGFMRASALCMAHHIPLSSHCAPAIHLHPCLAAPPVRHMEYFHDHVRIEKLLLKGAANDQDGQLAPGPVQAGHGLRLNVEQATPYRVP
jgi:L-alanine-DL-glutamate epimerase-like enolase superfamily enzyme